MVGWPMAAALLALIETGQGSQAIPEPYRGVWVEAGFPCAEATDENSIILAETRVVVRGVENDVLDVEFYGPDITVLSSGRWREPPTPSFGRYRLANNGDLLAVDPFFDANGAMSSAPDQLAVHRSFHRCSVTAKSAL